MDLVLELGGQHGLWAVEIKRSLAPVPTKGFHHAREDLQPSRTFIVYAGQDRYPLGNWVEVISLLELAEELAALQ